MELKNSEIEPSPLLQAGTWRTLAETHEHALVILAMGMDCSIHPIEGGYEILTAHDDAERAKRELALYSAEQSQPRRASPDELPDHPPGMGGLLVWALILAATYLRQMEDTGFTARFSNSSHGLMEQAEWWRPFTALFLHADPLHLLGNLLIGGMFCLLVAKSIGAWRGWLLILLGGAAGNAINAALRETEAFSSIGVSTATFAALGILVGLAIIDGARQSSYRSLRILFVPLLAGLILFSWFGISGENTDVGGHGWGSLCGLALGVIAGWLRFGGTHLQRQDTITHRRSGSHHAASRLG